MTIRVLREADRNIRRIGVFHEMAVLSAEAHQDVKDAEADNRSAVHGKDKRLVRAAQCFLEVVVDGLLCCSCGGVLIHGKRERILWSDFQWSTLGVLLVCEIDIADSDDVSYPVLEFSEECWVHGSTEVKRRRVAPLVFYRME